MTDDERDAIQAAISDEASDARSNRDASFLLMGRRYCSFCERPMDEDNPDPPRSCDGTCDVRRCPCGERLWTDEENDRGVCDGCYDSAGPARMTAAHREAHRRQW